MLVAGVRIYSDHTEGSLQVGEGSCDPLGAQLEACRGSRLVDRLGNRRAGVPAEGVEGDSSLELEGSYQEEDSHQGIQWLGGNLRIE